MNNTGRYCVLINIITYLKRLVLIANTWDQISMFERQLKNCEQAKNTLPEVRDINRLII